MNSSMEHEADHPHDEPHIVGYGTFIKVWLALVALTRPGAFRLKGDPASQPWSRAMTDAIRNAKHFLPRSALPP